MKTKLPLAGALLSGLLTLQAQDSLPPSSPGSEVRTPGNKTDPASPAVPFFGAPAASAADPLQAAPAAQGGPDPARPGAPAPAGLPGQPLSDAVYPPAARAAGAAGFAGPQEFVEWTSTPRGFVFNREEGGGSVVAFEKLDQAAVDQMAEDLKILGFILNRNLERTLGDDAPDASVYKLGIPMLLESGDRPIEASYIEGFGVLLGFRVRFPLLGPPAPEAREEAAKVDSEWERARLAVNGQAPAGENWNSAMGPDTARFSPRLVEILKKRVIETLKNAANLRHMRPEEFVAVEIVGSPNGGRAPAGGMGGGGVTFGGGGAGVGGGGGGFGGGTSSAGGGSEGAQPGAPTRGYSEAFMKRYKLPPGAMRLPARSTIMTIRVKKGDADSFAAKAISPEEFERKVEVHTYLRAAASTAQVR